MKLEFQEMHAKKIVNVYKHVTGPWFWNKYSAHPYIGCRSGCEFCYLRGGIYLGRRDPERFDTLVQVKTNAVELLHKELSRLEPDVIGCGDWQQPAEDRYQLSRLMLEAVLEYGFPLLVIERSDLLLRDVDLLLAIQERSWVSVVYSMSNLDPVLKAAFEPRSPGLRRRLEAIRFLADSGIPVGISLMPIIPFLGDDRAHLDEVIMTARDYGAQFVIAGGITMDGVQAERTWTAAGRVDPAVEQRWRQLYNDGEPSTPQPSGVDAYPARLGRLVRELCEKHGVLDRMPRYIPAGPLGVNKHLAERLFLKTYDLELEGAAPHRIWAYRKAAWTVDELNESIAMIYASQGAGGLRALPDIGASLAGHIAKWLVRENYLTESHKPSEGKT